MKTLVTEMVVNVRGSLFQVTVIFVQLQANVFAYIF
jgi:hypothetical protein